MPLISLLMANNRTSNQLRKQGCLFQAGGARSIQLRNNLKASKSTLKYQKKKYDNEAYEETETQRPDYLNTPYVVNFKGFGHICQQIFVDAYSKLAFCKLYTTKTPITTTDVFNDKVLPFFEEQGLPMLRIPTDRRTKYCSRVHQHNYQPYLAINDIDKAMSSKANSICKRFHKTILNEFYQTTFRKKLYTTMDELQKGWDEQMTYYNNEQTHQGRRCCGQTPIDTLVDAKTIWAEKKLAQI